MIVRKIPRADYEAVQAAYETLYGLNFFVWGVSEDDPTRNPQYLLGQTWGALLRLKECLERIGIEE